MPGPVGWAVLPNIDPSLATENAVYPSNAPGDVVRVGGTVYMYVQFDSAGVFAAVGDAAFLKTTATYAPNQNNPQLVVTNYANALGTGSVNTIVPLGVFLNALTAGNYGWVAVRGLATANFNGATTAGHFMTTSAGDAWTDAGVAAAPTSGTFGRILQTIGVAGVALALLDITGLA